MQSVASLIGFSDDAGSGFQIMMSAPLIMPVRMECA